MLNLYQNDLFAHRYRLKERLGGGGFSEVWLVYNETAGIEQALKVYTGVGKEGAEIFRSEFIKVYHLSHPRILRATEFDFYKEHPYLVMPYCKQGTALSMLGNMREKELARVMRDIGGALAYIHTPKVNLVHKDVKPDNFLINLDGEYLLADFGISSILRKKLREDAELRGTTTSSGAGVTPIAYRAPEYFEKNAHLQDPVKSTDVWAFGASLYELATGQQPFGQLGGSAMFNNPIPPDLPNKFSSGLNRILKQCMAKQTWERPLASDLEKWGDVYLKTGHWSREGNQTRNSRRKKSLPVKSPPRYSYKPLGRKDSRTYRIPNRQAPSAKFSPYIIGPIIVGVLVILGSLAFAFYHFYENPVNREKQEELFVDIERSVVQYEERNDSLDNSLSEAETYIPSPLDSIQTLPLVDTFRKTSVAKLVNPKDGRKRFLKPYIEKEPNDQRSNSCRISLEEVEVTTESTIITLYLGACDTINLFHLEKPESAYYIKDEYGKEYRLKDVQGIRTGMDIVIEPSQRIQLYFPSLDRSIRRFDLIEGKESFAEDHDFWNFKGIHLEDNDTSN